MQNRLVTALENLRYEIPPEKKVVGEDFLKFLEEYDTQLANTNNYPLIKKKETEIQELNYKIIDVFATTFSFLANECMQHLKARLETEAKQSTDYKPETWDELKAISRLQDGISKYFEEQIVKEESHTKRAIIIERAINIGWKCAKNHDYFTAQAILIALDKTNTGVKRLIIPSNLTSRARGRLDALRNVLPATQNNEDQESFRDKVADITDRKILGNFTSITLRSNVVSAMAESAAILNDACETRKSKEAQTKLRKENRELDKEEFNKLYSDYPVSNQKIANDLTTKIIEYGDTIDEKLQIDSKTKNVNDVSDLLKQLETNPNNEKFIELYNKFVKSYSIKLDKKDISPLIPAAILDENAKLELLKQAREKLKPLQEQQGQAGYNAYEKTLYEQSKRRLGMGNEIHLHDLESAQLKIVTFPKKSFAKQAEELRDKITGAIVDNTKKAIGAIAGVFSSDNKDNIDKIESNEFGELYNIAASLKDTNPAEAISILELISCRPNSMDHLVNIKTLRNNLIFNLQSQLTGLSTYYFSQLTDFAEYKTDSPNVPLSHRRLAGYFNTLANLVQYSILQDLESKLSEETKILRRAITMERWVEVMQRCVNVNDMNSALAINAAFRSSNIMRLHKSYAALSSKSKEFLNNFAKIDADPYRVTTARKQNLIPYHGSYTGQLALESREGRSDIVANELKEIHNTTVSLLRPKTMTDFQTEFSRTMLQAQTEKLLKAESKIEVLANPTTKKEEEKNNEALAVKNAYMKQVDLILQEEKTLSRSKEFQTYSTFTHSDEELRQLSDECKKSENAAPTKKQKVTSELTAYIFGPAKIQFPELVAIYTNYKEILKKSRDLDAKIKDLPRIKQWNQNVITLLKIIDNEINHPQGIDIKKNIENLKTELKEIYKLSESENDITQTMEDILNHFRALRTPFEDYVRGLPKQVQPPIEEAHTPTTPVTHHPLASHEEDSELHEVAPPATQLPLQPINSNNEVDQTILKNDIREFEKVFIEPLYRNYPANLKAKLEARYSSLLEIEADNLTTTHKELLTPKSNGPGMFNQTTHDHIYLNLMKRMELIHEIVLNEILMAQPDLSPLILERYIRLMVLAYNRKDLVTAAAIHTVIVTSPLKDFTHLWKSILSDKKVEDINNHLNAIFKNTANSVTTIQSIDLNQLESKPHVGLPPLWHEGMFEIGDKKDELVQLVKDYPISDIITKNELSDMIQSYPDVSTEKIKLHRHEDEMTDDALNDLILALQELNVQFETFINSAQESKEEVKGPGLRK